MKIKENNYFVFGTEIEINFKYILKRIFLSLTDVFFTLYLNLFKKKSERKKYFISICAIFKDESPNLKEWIEFHKIVGVDHFFLFNNNSSDNFKLILSPYVESGIVTLIEWPFSKGQFSAYEYFYKNYKNETNWVIFLDIDEFITPIKNFEIKDWIENFSIYPAIVIYWKMFGSSGKIKHDYQKLTTEQYVVCWDKMYDVGKTIINTNFDIANFNSSVHHATTIKVKIFGFNITIPPVNEFKRFIKWEISRVGIINKKFSIQINHYWSRSFEYYFENKVKRGDVNNHERTIDTFFAHEKHNNDVDFKIFKYIIHIKRAIETNG